MMPSADSSPCNPRNYLRKWFNKFDGCTRNIPFPGFDTSSISSRWLRSAASLLIWSRVWQREKNASAWRYYLYYCMSKCLNLSRLGKPCLYTHVHVCLQPCCLKLGLFTRIPSFINVLDLLPTGHKVASDQSYLTLPIQLQGCIRNIFLPLEMLTSAFGRCQMRLSWSRKLLFPLQRPRSTSGKIVLLVPLHHGKKPHWNPQTTIRPRLCPHTF